MASTLPDQKHGTVAEYNGNIGNNKINYLNKEIAL